jgi:hypothetical protein
MYKGGDDAPVLLFVPGATRKGREDMRVVRAAKALAAANRRVSSPSSCCTGARSSAITRGSPGIEGMAAGWARCIPWTEAFLLEKALPRTRLALLHHFKSDGKDRIQVSLIQGDGFLRSS